MIRAVLLKYALLESFSRAEISPPVVDIIIMLAISFFFVANHFAVLFSSRL